MLRVIRRGESLAEFVDGNQHHDKFDNEDGDRRDPDLPFVSR